MRWLSLTGQLLAAAGAICTVLYPFERLKGLVGEVTEGAVHDYTHGVPLSAELRRQGRQLRGGLWLMAIGFLLQAAGTACGL